MEWQPIKTAPKDGTKILTYQEWASYTISYFDPKWGNWVGASSARYDPTHWMPLPKPPSDV
jgi:hypothetical protein